MRNFFLLVVAVAFSVLAHAQTTSDFESLPLVRADTYYVNYSASGTDVGFSNGSAYFPCIYDTSFGGYWSTGFAYSNMTDDTTSGYLNQYSAVTGKGVMGSGKYAVAYCGVAANTTWVRLTGTARGHRVLGTYVTNSTYAHNSMRDGDFVAKKFGGISGNDPDWFMLTVRGYLAGIKKTDSVNFYLADYRPSGTTNDSIIKSWRWVDLTRLGNVDSVAFSLTSSDTGSFGMNTPSYFCMDNFIAEGPVGINDAVNIAAKVYPVPATNELNIVLADEHSADIAIIDATGKVVFSAATSSKHTVVNTSLFAPGVYVLSLRTDAGTATIRFNKQ